MKNAAAPPHFSEPIVELSLPVVKVTTSMPPLLLKAADDDDSA